MTSLGIMPSQWEDALASQWQGVALISEKYSRSWLFSSCITGRAAADIGTVKSQLTLACLGKIDVPMICHLAWHVSKVIEGGAFLCQAAMFGSAC